MSRINSIHVRLLMVSSLAGTVSAADWWDDFSNNMATDLAPLLSLFGEQVTKQFLSESTSVLDNFIFAMAPLGIITAVISAIRVCGGPSLRAFIGRAQEGGGIAEAELCSSTSRDVCELYHNGAIVRVFGRPKILEVVLDREATDFYDRAGDGQRPQCGVYFFKDYLGTKSAKDAGWRERGTREDVEDSKTGNEDMFAPNPNLSLNIGIRKRPVWVSWLAAVVGLLAQLAVMGFAIFTYRRGWKKEDSLPEPWAFPMMLSGTVLLSIGMFSNAYLIERSTKERVFYRSSISDKPRGSTSIYVTQPGNQNIGDQTYDAFAYNDSSESLNEYTTSWKPSQGPHSHLAVWLASGATLIGFAFQFVGLRAIHSAVSVVLLGAILVMSIIRAGLRTMRLDKKQNLLGDRPDQVEGHEMDWLAIHMGREPDAPRDESVSWSVVCTSAKKSSSPRIVTREVKDEEAADTDGPEDGIDILCEDAKVPVFAFRSRAEGTDNVSLDRELKTRRALRRTEARWLEQTEASENEKVKGPQLAARLLYYRSRLAELTTQFSRAKTKSSTGWDYRFVPVREQAQQLKKAIETSAEVLFTHAKFKAEWAGATSFAWSIDVAISRFRTKSKPAWSGSASLAWVAPRSQASTDIVHEIQKVHIILRRAVTAGGRTSNSWEVDQTSLEAVLGLWTWAITSNHLTQREDDAGLKLSTASEIPAARIIATGADMDKVAAAETGFKCWVDELPTFAPTKKWAAKPRMVDRDGNAIWAVEEDTLELQATPLPPDFDHQRYLRLFGWTGAPPAVGARSSVERHVLTADVKHSIPTLCAQDVYQLFLRAVASMLDSIEGKTSLVEGVHGAYLTNEVVTKLGDSIQQSGLGTRQDANFMVLPTLRSCHKLPVTIYVLPQAYNDADQHRLAGRFREAERILKWSYGIQMEAHDMKRDTGSLDATVMELCELYRYAYRAETIPQKGQTIRPPKGFFTQGMSWLKETRDRLVETWDPSNVATVIETLDRYVEFGNAVASETSHHSSNGTNILDALVEDNRAKCLWHISHATDVAEEQDRKGRSILSWAAERGWREVVKASLEIGSAVDSKDEDERTSLSYAAKNGHADVVRMLLQSGALPTSRDRFGRTPLSYASGELHLCVVQILVDDMRVTPEATDNRGHSPLHWAIMLGREQNSLADIVHTLLQGGELPTAQDSSGRTPLSYASEEGNLSAMQALMDDVHPTTVIKDIFGRTPLHWAAKSGNCKAIDFLVQHGADVESVDEQGHTPLLVALDNTQEGAVKRLAQLGAVCDLKLEITMLSINYEEDPIKNSVEAWNNLISWNKLPEAKLLLRLMNEERERKFPGEKRGALLLFQRFSKHPDHPNPPPPITLLAESELISDPAFTVGEVSENGVFVIATEETLRQFVKGNLSYMVWAYTFKDGTMTYTSHTWIEDDDATKTLLSHLGSEFKITSQLVKEANRKAEDWVKILMVLLDHDEDAQAMDIPADLLEDIACGYMPEAEGKAWFKRRKGDVPITTKCLDVAIENSKNERYYPLDALLRKGDKKLLPTATDITKVVARKYWGGLCIMQALVETDMINETNIADFLVTMFLCEDSIRSDPSMRSKEDLLDQLLCQQCEPVEITEEMAEAADQFENGSDLLSLIQDHNRRVKVEELGLEKTTE